MEKDTIKMTVDPKQLKSLYQAFKNLDEETNAALKVEVRQLSDYVARQIRDAAESTDRYPRQAALIAASVKANKDRIPNITIGGSRIARVSRKATSTNPRPKVGQLLFGSEFGAKDKGASAFSQGGRKFPNWNYKKGYWIFPTLRRLQPKITTDYHAIIDKYIRKDW